MNALSSEAYSAVNRLANALAADILRAEAFRIRASNTTPEEDDDKWTWGYYRGAEAAAKSLMDRSKDFAQSVHRDVEEE